MAMVPEAHDMALVELGPVKPNSMAMLHDAAPPNTASARAGSTLRMPSRRNTSACDSANDTPPNADPIIAPMRSPSSRLGSSSASPSANRAAATASWENRSSRRPRDAPPAGPPPLVHDRHCHPLRFQTELPLHVHPPRDTLNVPVAHGLLGNHLHLRHPPGGIPHHPERAPGGHLDRGALGRAIPNAHPAVVGQKRRPAFDFHGHREHPLERGPDRDAINRPHAPPPPPSTPPPADSPDAGTRPP